VPEFERQSFRLHYRVEGPPDGIPVVFSHGGLLDSNSWRPQVEALRSDHRILLWDLPGHGGSTALHPYSNEAAAEALGALMDHVGMDRATHVGLSAGGWVGQALAYRRPDRVRGLAALGTTPLTLSRLPRPVAWLFRRSPALMRPWPWGLLRRFIVRILARAPEARAAVHEAASRVQKRDFLAFWAGVSRGLRWEPDWRFPRPLLIAHGERDAIGAVRLLSRRWSAHCPDAEYVTIPRAGHCAQLDNPSFTNAMLRRFIASAHADGSG